MSIAGQYLLIVGADTESVAGESEGKGYPAAIDIRSWDWSVTDQSSGAKAKSMKKGAAVHPGKSGEATSDEKGLLPDLFKFTKGVDTSSTRLMTAMDNNECLQHAKFVLREELAPGANDRHVPFVLHVLLEDVYVVGYSVQGRASDARVDLDESWELHYKTIKIDYVSAGGMNVEFERKAGAERGADDPDATLKKLKASFDDIKRKKGGG